MNLNEIINGTARDPFTGDLYEGLIYSVDTDKAVDILKRNLKDIPIFDINDYDDKYIAFVFKLSYPPSNVERMFGADIVDSNLSKIIRLVNNLGYFVSSYIFNPYNMSKRYKSSYSPTKFREDFFKMNPNYIIFVIEKKYDTIDEDIPEKIYHITNKSFINRVQSRGLIPRSGSKQSYHPERIYFTKNIEDMRAFSNMVSGYIPKENQLVLTIDTKGLDNTFYIDPNLDDAIYTYKNIDPKNIISYETF